MVREVTCYQDSSGVLHRTPLDAHRAELAIWLGASGALNEASAKALAEHMAEYSESLIDVLRAITQASPKDAALPALAA